MENKRRGGKEKDVWEGIEEKQPKNGNSNLQLPYFWQHFLKRSLNVELLHGNQKTANFMRYSGLKTMHLEKNKFFWTGYRPMFTKY